MSKKVFTYNELFTTKIGDLCTGLRNTILRNIADSLNMDLTERLEAKICNCPLYQADSYIDLYEMIIVIA